MEAISLPVLELIFDDAVVPVAKRGTRPAPAVHVNMMTKLRDDQVYSSQDQGYISHNSGPIPTYNLTPPPLQQHPQQSNGHQRSRSAYETAYYGPQDQSGPAYFPPPSQPIVYDNGFNYDSQSGPAGFQYYDQGFAFAAPTRHPAMGNYGGYQDPQPDQYGYTSVPGGV